MKQDVVIAHLSDLHLSHEYHRDFVIVADHALKFAQDAGADHVVLTGDISANADTGDFEVARQLLSRHGLLTPDKLSMVIGNHDVFGGVHIAEDILGFPTRCRRTDLRRKTFEFLQAFPEAFSGVLTVSDRDPFPFVKIVGPLAFIGLNSVAPYSSVRNPLGSNGEVDEAQMVRLERLLGSGVLEGKRKVVLIHHHFSKMEHPYSGTIGNLWGMIERQTLKLRGKRALLALFRAHGVEYVLHGHLHENRVYERRSVRCANAGGTVVGLSRAHHHVNILRVTPGGMTMHVHRLPRPGRQVAISLPQHEQEHPRASAAA